LFIYGDCDGLEKSMDILEAHRPIEGVTVGCEMCGYVSMISHTYHHHQMVNMDQTSESSVPNRNEYYTQMCMLAQRLTNTQAMLGKCK
jgi:hypothetical protein